MKRWPFFFFDEQWRDDFPIIKMKNFDELNTSRAILNNWAKSVKRESKDVKEKKMHKMTGKLM